MEMSHMLKVFLQREKWMSVISVIAFLLVT